MWNLATATAKCYILVFILSLGAAGLNPLNDYIKHYEGLNYKSELVHQQHSRARRSAENEAVVRINFKALGRNFPLRLKRDTSVFSKHLKAENVDGSLKDMDVSHIYTGEVYGEPRSFVHGSIINGMFAGEISLPGKKYYVEKAEQYFNKPQDFHSIIYEDKHLNLDPHRNRRSAESEGVCGITKSSVHEWMNNIRDSAIVKEGKTVSKRATSTLDSHAGMYSAEYAGEKLNRRKRHDGHDDDKRTCTLYLQSDPELWKYFRYEKGYARMRAEEEIAALFASHVTVIKQIYEDTTFKHGDDKQFDGISFVIRRVRILDNSTDTCSRSPTNKFCQPNLDVANFLNLNSLSNHTDYCLAYMFTYRDFTGGTLGLAWVGSPTRASGGICETYKEYAENGQRVMKSLNTGIVTLVNYGARVPSKVSALTFAHEVGHNFGAQHDTDVCTQQSSGSADSSGNFIMYASATSGDKPNNDKFSTCSISDITQVLDAVIHESNGKRMCLVSREAAFCGNSIVEEGEECDCGYEPCKDRCCHGRANNEGGQQNGDEDLQCTRKNSASCSPSEGPCCDESCNFLTDVLCQAESDCAAESMCSGVNATCPTPKPAENDTVCNEKTQICISGECTSSICEVSDLRWKQCYLTLTGDDDDKENLCYLACENKDTQECVGTKPGDPLLMKDENQALYNFLQMRNFTSEGIKLQPGAPCDNFRGYCDVFYRCRSVDADGPLARLTDLLFSDKTYTDIRNWIVTNWWAVLLIGVGVVIVMAVFIHCCAVHTPSSNPNKPPPRKLTLPRRPRGHHSGQQGQGGDRGRREGHSREGQGRSRGNQPAGRQHRSNRPATTQPPRASAAPADPSAPPPYSEIEMGYNPKGNRV